MHFLAEGGCVCIRFCFVYTCRRLINLSNDCRYNHDASLGCMDMCMMWADSAYNFTNFHIDNKVCKTNTPGNTATRTPGAAQAIFTTEWYLTTPAQSPPQLDSQRHLRQIACDYGA